jgi:hypothetical protein
VSSREHASKSLSARFGDLSFAALVPAVDAHVNIPLLACLRQLLREPRYTGQQADDDSSQPFDDVAVKLKVGAGRRRSLLLGRSVRRTTFAHVSYLPFDATVWVALSSAITFGELSAPV